MTPAWTARAACAGTSPLLFYPPDSEREQERVTRETAAKTICAACPVTADCLNDALTRGDRHGIWGGTTEIDRYHLTNPPARTRCRRRRHDLTQPGAVRWNNHGGLTCTACEQQAATRRRQQQGTAA